MGRRARPGDLFEVRVDSSTSAFFQYIVDDRTQLNSQVVRVSERFAADAENIVDFASIASSAALFHAHVLLAAGVKQGHWRVIGRAAVQSPDGVWFRDSGDYGNPRIKLSRDWYVWRPNEERRKIGVLGAPYQRAEIGVVVPPDRLIHRIRCGHYDFQYPGY